MQRFRIEQKSLEKVMRGLSFFVGTIGSKGLCRLYLCDAIKFNDMNYWTLMRNALKANHIKKITGDLQGTNIFRNRSSK